MITTLVRENAEKELRCITIIFLENIINILDIVYIACVNNLVDCRKLSTRRIVHAGNK
jgi:hypothetical protein